MSVIPRSWLRRVAAAVVMLATVVALPLTLVPAAGAETGGVDRTPVMGWSSWSFLRFGIDAHRIEAEARALKTSGLAEHGYRYVNVDDNWYQCPGPQGPAVGPHGRWLVNSTEFPKVGSENGIAAVAAYVHSLGLKFGIYETPGISRQAVAADDPILGTSDTADEIANGMRTNNYNCGGMEGIDYSRPGAQAYTDSVVDQLARWGVDYIKLDGITNRDGPYVEAWSKAIRQSGRPMVLNITQGSYTIKLAPTLDQFANQWEFTPDIEINGPDEGLASSCNTAPYTGCRSVFPLTSYAHWFDRFNAAARWAPFGGPGGFNDYDSIEVGDGTADSGMSPAAQRSQLSLWALGSAPLILGVNLTDHVTNAFGSSGGLTPSGLAMLENRQVIAVDQDAIDARRIADAADSQMFAKKVAPGQADVGLFDTDQATGAAAERISTTASALGLAPDARGYRVDDLWTGRQEVISSQGTITARVKPEGVALFKVTARGGAHQ